MNDSFVEGKRQSNLFGMRDESIHDKVMRPVKGLYTMTRALDMEPHIDTTINEWFEALDDRFAVGKNAGKSFDIGNWVPYCEWFVRTDG